MILNLFYKHMGYVAPEIILLTYENAEKNLYKFHDPLVNRHWLSFYATYRRGYNDACNEIGVIAVQNISKYTGEAK